MKNTGIGWAHHTLNFWEGCNEVSDECEGCYARSIVEGKGGNFNLLRPTGTSDQAYVWNAEAGVRGSTAFVFTCSMSDFFHFQADRWRARAWEIIRECTHLTWLILTKRPERIAEHLPPDWDEGRGYPHVWLGTTVGTRDSYKRLDPLRKVSCQLRFLSIEPLLEDLHDIDLRGIGWILVGGMSGPLWDVKEMEIAWAASLYDKALAAGVPYFFKQVSASDSERGINAMGLYLAKRSQMDVAPEAVDLVREFPQTSLPMMTLNREKGERLTAEQRVALGL